jgi:hypothetical protein
MASCKLETASDSEYNYIGKDSDITASFLNHTIIDMATPKFVILHNLG